MAQPIKSDRSGFVSVLTVVVVFVVIVVCYAGYKMVTSGNSGPDNQSNEPLLNSVPNDPGRGDGRAY